MDGRVCGWAADADAERQLQAQGDGRPKVSQGLHARSHSQARAARGPGSDRGAARFARNFVVMAPVGPLILSSPRERGCWRSSGWSSGKESASRVPIRHVQQGLLGQNRQGWLCLWLCRGPGAPLSYLERTQWGPHRRALCCPLTLLAAACDWLLLAAGCAILWYVHSSLQVSSGCQDCIDMANTVLMSCLGQTSHSHSDLHTHGIPRR